MSEARYTYLASDAFLRSLEFSLNAPTRLRLAKRELTTFFDHAAKSVFSTQDLQVLPSQNRSVWHLARSTTVHDFIEFLTKETQLKEVILKSKNYVLPTRFIWRRIAPPLWPYRLEKLAICPMRQYYTYNESEAETRAATARSLRRHPGDEPSPDSDPARTHVKPGAGEASPNTGRAGSLSSPAGCDPRP